MHREIDLVEEIARIEGYDRVPEDMAIAARPVEWSARELTVRRTGEVLVAAGLCEAMTRSVVPAAFEAFASPWGTAAALTISPPLVRGADRLRRTLIKILTHLGEPLEPPPLSPARGPPTDWGELVQIHDDRDVFQASPDDLTAIDIHNRL